MKTLSAFVIACLAVLAFSCHKSSDTPSTTTVSADSLLIGKTWKIQTITFVQSNVLYTYVRGGSNNPYDFTNEAIVFKKDLTGTYTTGANSYTTTWQFVDAEKTKIKFIIANYDKGAPKPGVNLTINWENVVLTTSSLKYAEIYTNNDGTSVMSSATRIPL